MSCDDAPLAHLPVEVHAHILSYLATSDRQNLRLVSTYFQHKTPLQLTRVFLSANPRNINVFRAIADHEALRNGVTEIIWDDAVFPAMNVQRIEHIWVDDATFTESRALTMTFRLLVESQLPLTVSYAYYEDLKICRRRITPAAHGLLHEPLYETPMIRGFPNGFTYPIPRGWPTQRHQGSSPPIPPPWGVEYVRRQWCGISTVLRALVEQENGVVELVVDVHGLCTGMNPTMFNDPAYEAYQDLVALLRKPGFRRIGLSLLAAQEQYQQKPPCSDGRLRHDLMNLLADMPPSLRSAELSNLRFITCMGDAGSYRSLLCDMRHKLDWRGRPAGERPRVAITVGNGFKQQTVVDRVVSVEEELSDFLCNDGRNPFGDEADVAPNQIRWGLGVEWDVVDPDFEMPW
ncbi:hypothetical protein PG994_003415 [Apiospora phragmitis]|uniref:F-box domain-containing protein n=1 Tax=Apiospora phragmitis TaxID=2905665 RepID=A0ABR1W201_9PEZI